MKSRTKAAETGWVLDNDTITVFIPMTWKRRSGQKVIIAPDGGDAWAPAKSRPDETLIRALARAHRWNRMLEEGRYRSAQEIADAEKIGRSFVSRLLNLIPNAFGEKPVLKLMFGAMIRAAERWQAIKVTDFERGQMATVRCELNQEYEASNGLIRKSSDDASNAKLSSTSRT